MWLDQPGGGSRNLSRYRQWANKHDSRLKFGGEQAVQAMLQFPATIHDIGGPAENFCVDAMVVPHGNDPALLVTIHGQYVERMSLLFTSGSFVLTNDASSAP